MTDKVHKISWETVVEIENQLNQCEFMSAPIGGLFAATLYEFWWLGISRFPLKKRIKYTINKLRYKKLVNKPDLNIKYYANELNGKHVFNIVESSNRLTSFFAPLHQFLPDNSCIYTGQNQNTDMVNDTKYLNLPFRLNKVQKIGWLKEYKKTETEAIKLIKRICVSQQFPDFFMHEMEISLILQTQAFFICNELFEKGKPKNIVVDHDRQAFSSAMIAAAKKAQIPTFTFLHGNTYPNAEGFYPVLADKIFCWGTKHFTQLKELGITESKLLITCNTKVNNTVNNNSEVLRSQFNIPKKNKVVLLATNNIEINNRYKLAASFAEFCRKAPQWSPVIRLHPVEKKEEYQEISNHYPEVIISDSKEMSYEDSFALADTIVNHNSLYGLEALMKQKNVLILDTIDENLFIGEELVKQGNCPRIRTSDDFLNALNQEVSTQQKKYINSYYSAYGNEAAKNIVTYLN